MANLKAKTSKRHIIYIHSQNEGRHALSVKITGNSLLGEVQGGRSNRGGTSLSLSADTANQITFVGTSFLAGMTRLAGFINDVTFVPMKWIQVFHAKLGMNA